MKFRNSSRTPTKGGMTTRFSVAHCQVITISLQVLIFGGYAINKEKPPIPAKVLDHSGSTLFTGEDVIGGQNYFLPCADVQGAGRNPLQAVAGNERERCVHEGQPVLRITGAAAWGARPVSRAREGRRVHPQRVFV